MTAPTMLTDTDALISTLPPIGLDELMARASLLTRLDRKYVLMATDLPAFVRDLAGDVRVLEIDRCRAFTYRSVYFDTPDLDSYLAAAHGRRRRFKLRIRSYRDSDLHFLEVKTRGRRGTTVKERIPYAGDARALDSDARAHIGAVLDAAGLHTDLRRLRRMMTTEYRRTTLYLASTASRVTIDTALNWQAPDGTAVTTPGRVIVETKSDRATSAADRLLWSRGHRPCGISKYATGLAALRPELPANRWQPVLRRHFHRG